jgi:general secretion pathway protein D
VVVDPGGNRILFTGSADDFTQLRNLLLTLDAPLREVLVEVTIAEVTLTDETRVGLEWFFTHSGSRGVTSGGTLGNLGLGASGLKLKFTGTDLQAAFNAFASNNNVNILSRPRLVARSGGEAKIQVGTDVPIITSRANSSTQTGGSTDILQTIQYRQTGVILQIRPLVYGDDRVDLEITQEVSSQQPNSNATIGSPLILNRNISTQLSLTEGATAVLGGLIDSSFTKGNSGIPFLKDIPILGSAFRSDTVNGGKTELVMLVTPHIVRDTEDMNRWARRYGDEMDDAFRIGRNWSYTLTPFTVRALGSDLAREKAVVAPGGR